MYLLRRLNKTGVLEVYEIDPIECKGSGKNARLQSRRERAWSFGYGVAAIADDVTHGLAMLEKEATNATVGH